MIQKWPKTTVKRLWKHTGFCTSCSSCFLQDLNDFKEEKTSLILFEISIHQNKGETTNIVVSRLLFSFKNEQASMSSIHSAFFTRMSYVHKSKLTDDLTKL